MRIVNWPSINQIEKSNKRINCYICAIQNEYRQINFGLNEAELHNYCTIIRPGYSLLKRRPCFYLIRIQLQIATWLFIFGKNFVFQIIQASVALS